MKSPGSSSGSSSISTSEIQCIITQLRNAKYRQATKKKYLVVWKKFNKFFVQLDEKPTNWEDRTTLFVGYLSKERKQSSTRKSCISAIKAVLADTDISVNEDRFLLNSLTRACHLNMDHMTVKLPIHKDLLNTILCITGKLFHQAGQVYLVVLYQALFVTTYYGLFCIGELTFSPHTVKACNVYIANNKKKILFVLRSSKTHSKGSSLQLIKITNTPQLPVTTDSKVVKPHCPCQLLQNYLCLCCGFVDYTENFFIFRDYSPVYPYHFSYVLRNILKQIFKSHILCRKSWRPP